VLWFILYFIRLSYVWFSWYGRWERLLTLTTTGTKLGDVWYCGVRSLRARGNKRGFLIKYKLNILKLMTCTIFRFNYFNPIFLYVTSNILELPYNNLYKRNWFNFELFYFRFLVTSLCLKEYINDLSNFFGLKIRAVTYGIRAIVLGHFWGGCAWILMCDFYFIFYNCFIFLTSWLLEIIFLFIILQYVLLAFI
jgi:hypothetical protein